MAALKLDLSFTSPELEQEFQEAQALRSQRLERQASGGVQMGSRPAVALPIPMLHGQAAAGPAVWWHAAQPSHGRRCWRFPGSCLDMSAS